MTTLPKFLLSATLVALLGSLLAPPRAARADVNNPGDVESYREKVDRAIDRGLAFLATQQLDQAKAAKLNAPILVGNLSDGIVGNTGITSLSVMAFLAKGHTPGLGPYGDTINHGIDYILAQQEPTGLLESQYPAGRSQPMYAHSISTLLLAEVSGMVDPVRQQKIDKALPKALGLILKAQAIPKDPNNAGGWRYTPTSTDSDMSLTGWAIMALRAGKLNGAPVPSENIDKAVQYILRCRNPQNSGFAYTPGGGPNHGLTAAGILCLELCGKHGHESIKPAGVFLMQNQMKGFQPNMQFFYATYYGGQAAFQLGPEFWGKYAPQMYENLLAGQQPADGGWPPADNLGRCFSTSMAILAMTPSYRQLPIYQRDESYEGQSTPNAKP